MGACWSEANVRKPAKEKIQISYKNWETGERGTRKCKKMNHLILLANLSKSVAKNVVKNINNDLSLVMIFIIIFLTLERTYRNYFIILCEEETFI